jgi:hypothetical protein
LVRLVEAPGQHHVLCDARVRGIPGTAPGYRATLAITYPNATVVTKNAVVSSAAPLSTDNTDGKFEAALVESPPGSGEYTVRASFKRATSADTGAHLCEATLEELDAGSAVVAELLHDQGRATSRATGAAAPYLTATSHRQSGSHLSCVSRLNFANSAATYDVEIATKTPLGIDVRTLQIDATEPFLGPIPTPNGGDVFVEWGTAPWSAAVPSLDVRFDFLGTVGSTACDFVVREVGSGITVLSEASRRGVVGEILVLQNDDYAAGGAVTLNTGVDLDEYMAARFSAAPVQYPFRIRKIRVLCGNADGTEIVVAPDIFRDTGNLNPGSILYSSADFYLLACPAGLQFNEIDLTSKNIVVDAGTIRVALFVPFDPGAAGFATDTSGIQPGRNLVMQSNGVWSLAENQGVTGDWILRVEVETL